MSYTRKICIEYYQVVRTPRGESGTNKDQLFELEELIEIADNMKLEERTFDYYQEQARLDKLNYNLIDNY